MARILVINTGSTSTKIAVFVDDKPICETNLEHPKEELLPYTGPLQQRYYRTARVRAFLQASQVDIGSLDAVAARGGSFAVFEAGAYEVNETMLAAMRNSSATPGASWLSALIAYDIAQEAGIRAYIYDAVSVDEMREIAHISGLASVSRKAASHTLNTKAVGRRVAARNGSCYEESRFIITHLGGGISTSAHCLGRIVDLVADDEGTFSPERPGRIPCSQLVDLCYSGAYTYGEMKRKMRGEGGLVSYLGTTDCREVERRIENGDEQARRIYQAMAYQVAKDIASMAPALQFQIDDVILTGGIAHSTMLTGMIADYINGLAPIVIVPGSFEMEALAEGVERVLAGKEEAHSL